jgi:hypothetical protein
MQQAAFVDRSDGSHAQSSYNHMTQEIAQLVIEILRSLKRNAESPIQGILLDPEPREIIDPAHGVEEGEIIDATILNFFPEPRSPAALPSVDDLDSFSRSLQTPPEMLQTAENLIAGTVDQLVNHYGDRNGQYITEKYHLQQEGNQYRIYDEKGYECFAAEKRGNDDYEILNNELSGPQMVEVLRVRVNMEEQGLKAIDNNFKSQLDSLGNLAPEGTQAAFVAEYLLEGYNTDSIQMPHYGFSRDNQGNITITRENSPSSDVRSTHDLTQNPLGYIVLRTESGNITESHLTSQDKENFAQVARYAQEHPIGPEVQAMATVGRGFDRSS